MSGASPIIAVFAGGTSAEREVSLGSGRASAIALARSFPTRLFEVNSAAIPAGVDPARHVVFSTLHGTFGEDGGMQRLLDAAGIHYAGCDAASSALTMDKTRSRLRPRSKPRGARPEDTAGGTPHFVPIHGSHTPAICHRVRTSDSSPAP